MGKRGNEGGVEGVSTCGTHAATLSVRCPTLPHSTDDALAGVFAVGRHGGGMARGVTKIDP